jgi:hypothetical protein
MGPGETKTWIINKSYKVVMGQLESILYDLQRLFLFYYEDKRRTESSSIFELFVKRPPTYGHIKEYFLGEQVTPRKSWGFAGLKVMYFDQDTRVELETGAFFLDPDEVKAPLNYLITELDEYKKSIENSISFREDITRKRRKGGPLGTPEEEKIAYVTGWENVQGNETQEAYCSRKGISPSTLRRWKRELISEGKLPPS